MKIMKKKDFVYYQTWWGKNDFSVFQNVSGSEKKKKFQ